jgi:hypothetical protein
MSLCITPYGNTKIPFSDPAWYRGAESPYYRESHAQLRDKVQSMKKKIDHYFCSSFYQDKVKNQQKIIN